jgi:hypothetical protein
VQWVNRIGRGVGVGAGAVVGFCLGVWLGGAALAIAYLIGNDVVGNIALLLVLPLRAFGGAFLGARQFLRFRAFANRLRLRHRRRGALTWMLGSALLALLAALAVTFLVAVYDDLNL